MAYVIAEPCIDHMDQSCVAVCPVDCIQADPDVDRKYHIDPDACIDCGSCEAACPNTAIFKARDLPVEWAGYAWVDATWFRDPAAARAAIADVATPAA
ncbi:MAG: ferredoxin family protein [Candidatus Limnocylindrales bacterium]